jgi:hypothetical protein
MNKELKKICKEITAKGFTVVPAGKHQKVKNAAGKTIFTLPTSPSGSLWQIRLKTQLRKHGLID